MKKEETWGKRQKMEPIWMTGEHRKQISQRREIRELREMQQGTMCKTIVGYI